MKLISKLSDWYFSRKTLPHWGVLMLDCFIVLFASFVGKYYELDDIGFTHSFRSIVIGALLTTLLYAISFISFRTYRGIIRYSSFIDLQRIVFATLVGAVLTGLLSFVDEYIPNCSVASLHGVVVTFFISTMLMWMERVAVKRMYDNFHTDNSIPVAIYGTKAGGISLAKSISSVKDKKYTLEAFISDGMEMKDVILFGKKIYLNHSGIAEKMKRLGVQTLLVSPLKTEMFRQNNEMVDEFLAAGIHIMMMPATEEWDGTS